MIINYLFLALQIIPIQTNILIETDKEKSEKIREQLEKTKPIIEIEKNKKNQYNITSISEEDDAFVYGKIKKFIPKFVYFDETDILKDFVDIPKFLANPNEYSKVKELLTFCGLDVKTLKDTQSKPAETDEIKKRKQRLRKNKTNSAQKRLTKEIQDLWQQNVHSFIISLDGDSITIETYDKKNPSPIDLTRKSKGIQWYVSFVIKFDVQTKGELKNAILLFDEPSNALHPQAQFDFINYTVCDRLTKTNQVISATHSPFLLGEDTRIKIMCVERNDEGMSKIIKTSEVKRKNTLLPLRALFGYDSLSHIFDEDNILIVEGWNDKKYIELFNFICSKNNITELNPSIYIIQLNGTGKAGKFLSIFQNKANKIVVFLDSDKAGNETKKIIEKEFDSPLIIQTEEFRGDLKTSEIEDIIPRKLYLKEFIKQNKKYSIDIDKIGSQKAILEEIDIYFKKNSMNIVVDKQKINKSLIKLLYTTKNEELIERSSNVIETINNKFNL